MSIYASIPGIDDGAPCGPPWIYLGSHHLPDDTDRRGGEVSLALIPSHITRDGRDDQPEDGTPWPWLRLSVDPSRSSSGDPTVLLSPAQARHLRDRLTTWLDSTEPDPPRPAPAPAARHRGGNAEDCPACDGTNPDYPFICPGEPEPDAR